jgi:hypothetical protein
VLTIEPPGRLLLPVKCRRRDRQRAIEEIVADDDHRQPGRAGVLLRAGVDHAELRDVDHPGQDVRRHVGDERHVAGLGRPLVFDAADRLVRADVHVRGIAVELPRAERGMLVKFVSSDEATIFTWQYLRASLIDFFDHSPVLT